MSHLEHLAQVVPLGQRRQILFPFGKRHGGCASPVPFQTVLSWHAHVSVRVYSPQLGQQPSSCAPRHGKPFL